MLPRDAWDEGWTYAGEVPARAKCTGAQGAEWDVGMLECTRSAIREDRGSGSEDIHQSRRDWR